MAKLVLKDAEVVVNGVDLSDHVSAVTINYTGELQDQTAMGDDTRSRLSGLKDWSFEITFQQDFSSGSVDATLFTLIGAAAIAVTVMGNKTSGVGVTNPKFSGSCVLESYPPMGNTVGELAATTVTFQAAGDLSRLTA